MLEQYATFKSSTRSTKLVKFCFRRVQLTKMISNSPNTKKKAKAGNDGLSRRNGGRRR